MAVASLAGSSALIASCGAGGNGVGSAPNPPPPCGPAVPADKSPCSGPQVCSYPGGVVALCPSVSDVWVIQKPGDGGMLADAPLPEASTDADAGADGEVSDDAEADAAVDAAEETAADSESDADAAATDGAVTDSAADVAIDLGLGG